MGLFDKLFSKNVPLQPEDKYKVTITLEYIKVEHPDYIPELISWNEIKEIKLINTDEGPWLPDVWLVLSGNGRKCTIPQGAKGYDEALEKVSNLEGFNFENIAKSMTCTNNAEFHLWPKSLG